MKKIDQALVWCVLLNKRFLRKPSFLVILFLVPLLALALSVSSPKDGGPFIIALCPAEDDGGFSKQIVDELCRETTVVKYLLCEDMQSAQKLVVDGTADAAWIFYPDSMERIGRYVEGKRTPAVRILEKEENTFLLFAQERLFAALFPHIADDADLQLIRGLEDPGIPIEERWATLEDHTPIDQDLVQFSFMGGAEAKLETNYLLFPVRGLLSIFAVLSGLAAGIILKQDEQRQVLAWASEKGRIFASAGYYVTALTDVCIVIVLALFFSGLAVAPGYELLLTILLILSGSGFGALVAQLCGTAQRISIAALILTLCMLGLCPLFLNVRELRFASYLFPPFYYLHAVHNRDYAEYLLFYSVIVWCLFVLLRSLTAVGTHHRIRKQKRIFIE